MTLKEDRKKSIKYFYLGTGFGLGLPLGSIIYLIITNDIIGSIIFISCIGLPYALIYLFCVFHMIDKANKIKNRSGIKGE